MSQAPGQRVARLVIDLHDDGGLSVSGNVGDVHLATQMLDHAREAVRNQLKQKTEIVIPNRDVVASPDESRFPLGPVVAA